MASLAAFMIRPGFIRARTWASFATTWCSLARVILAHGEFTSHARLTASIRFALKMWAIMPFHDAAVVTREARISLRRTALPATRDIEGYRDEARRHLE